jgi:proteasome lid subunit RPN8/RPN11
VHRRRHGDRDGGGKTLKNLQFTIVNGEFHLAPAARKAIVTYARSARPAECCGVLVGGEGRIDLAVPARNIADESGGDPTRRFVIDPADHIQARREARRRGLTVVGFYHSHPATPAWPSPTDIAESNYGDAVHLIVSLAGDAADVRLFRLEDGTAVEVAISLDEPPA